MSEIQSVSGPEQAVQAAWDAQSLWSETANALKRQLTGWRNAAAIAGFLGAVLATLAASLEFSNEKLQWIPVAIAGVAAVVLAIVPYVAHNRVSKQQVSEWVRSRSASEAIKETIYRYLLGAQPFGPTKSVADLAKRCEEIEDKVRDLWISAAEIQQPVKTRPLTLTPDQYRDERVTKQIRDFYRPQATKNAKRARFYRGLEFWLGLLAVVFGTLSAFGVNNKISVLLHLGPWVAVVTTATAAVAAHLSASRFDYQAMMYFGTSKRLQALLTEWLNAANPDDPSVVCKFVDACEQVISSENQSWLTEWQRDVPATEAETRPSDKARAARDGSAGHAAPAVPPAPAAPLAETKPAT